MVSQHSRQVNHVGQDQRPYQTWMKMNMRLCAFIDLFFFTTLGKINAVTKTDSTFKVNMVNMNKEGLILFVL